MLKNVKNDTRKDIEAIYKELSKIELSSLGLDIVYSEKDEAAFILEVSRVWSSEKPKIKESPSDLAIVGRYIITPEVFDWLKELVGDKKEVLDLGCGTGIATRQLAELGFRVTGVDLDERMIKEAQNTGGGINYVISLVNQLPFTAGQFEIITAFSAFHWFCDKDSIKEIWRVLAPDGLLFIVNKNDKSQMRKMIRDLIKKEVKQNLPSKPETYDPKRILEENEFNNVHEKVFEVIEYYSLEEAIGYTQTMSIWNLVPSGEKGRILIKIKDKLSAEFDNQVPREIEIKAVAGLK